MPKHIALVKQYSTQHRQTKHSSKQVPADFQIIRSYNQKEHKDRENKDAQGRCTTINPKKLGTGISKQVPQQ